MSYSVMYDKKYNNRYVINMSFTDKGIKREAVIDTACSTTLIPTKIAEQFGIKHGNRATVIVGGGTYNAALYTFDNVMLGDLKINKLSAFTAEYTGYLKNRILLGMNILLNLNINLKRSETGILQFNYEPWAAVSNRKYPCGFFFADSGSKAVYPDLLVEDYI